MLVLLAAADWLSAPIDAGVILHSEVGRKQKPRPLKLRTQLWTGYAAYKHSSSLMTLYGHSLSPDDRRFIEGGQCLKEVFRHGRDECHRPAGAGVPESEFPSMQQLPRG